LLEGAGLPLTLEHSSRLLRTLMKILKREFKVVPHQPLSKLRTAKLPFIETAIVKAVKSTLLKRTAADLPKGLGPLLDSKKISVILYERFRSEAIHGGTLSLNDTRFFSENSVYWEPRRSEHGSYELIEFAAPFLLQILRSCQTTYKAHLIAKKKLPPSIYLSSLDGDIGDHLEFFDETLLPDGGEVRLKID